MGFFKELGGLVGAIAGGVIGGSVAIVGEVIGSDFVKEIGESVCQVSINAGQTVGQAADGVSGVVGGIITQDDKLINQGFNDVGKSIEKTALGMINGVGHIATNSVEVLEGVVSGNTDQTVKGAKNLIKVAAIATLGVGIADYVGIIGDDFSENVDGDYIADSSLESINDYNVIESAEDVVDIQDSHYVNPHYVDEYVRSDGTPVRGYYRDGDGDSSTHLNADNGGGYLRRNS